MEHLYSGCIGTNKEFSLIQADVNETMLELVPSSVQLVIGDPPYNTSKAGGRYGYKGKKFMQETWDVIEDYASFSKAWMDNAKRVMKDNGTLYVWSYHRSIPYLPLLDWYVLNLLTWKKTNAFPNTMQNSVWPSSCEFLWFLRKAPGKDHVFHIGKEDFPKDRDTFVRPIITNKRHPSEKPLDITMELVRRSTNEGDTVLDLFSGSGTVLEACLKLNRKCISVERSSEYVEMIIKRISPYSEDGLMSFDLPA